MKLPIQTTTQLMEMEPTVIAAGIGSEENRAMTITQKLAMTCSVDRPTKIAIIGTMTKNFETTSLAKMPPIIAMLTTKFATMPSTCIPSMCFSTLPMEIVDSKCVGSMSANLADMPNAAPMMTTPIRLEMVDKKTIHTPFPQLCCLVAAP